MNSLHVTLKSPMNSPHVYPKLRYSCDAGYGTEAQKILERLNNIEETRQNIFGRIRFLEKSITFRFMSINIV